MAAFMLMASIPDILQIPQAVEVFSHLGYPTYLLPFLGTAKTLGVIAVLLPGFRRLKEWAYAGLVWAANATVAEAASAAATTSKPALAKPRT